MPGEGLGERSRHCELHEDREAIVRSTTPSAAGTPLIQYQCEDCFEDLLNGFSIFGNTLDEVEIYDERAEELMEEYGIEELPDAEVNKYYVR